MELPDRIEKIIQMNCLECHGKNEPAKQLVLEKTNWNSNLININCGEIPSLKIIDLVEPEKSYLLMKIKGEKGILGQTMPLGKPALKTEDIQTVSDWIQSFIAVTDKKSEGLRAPEKKFASPPFQSLQLINLPTTKMMPARSVWFRLTHHFYSSVKTGYGGFYGFDGPAVVFLSFGYGISDRLNLILGRSNLFQEFELSLKWLLHEPAADKKFPIGATLILESDLATQSRPGINVFDRDNLKLNLKLSLSWQPNNRITMLLVPAYSTNTNHLNAKTQGTFILGGGLRLNLIKDISLLGEWLPVLSGYKIYYNGWSLGIEKKIGWHVFQFYLLNSLGITTDQYLPGGDLRLGDGDWRFGFTIFRQFK